MKTKDLTAVQLMIPIKKTTKQPWLFTCLTQRLFLAPFSYPYNTLLS